MGYSRHNKPDVFTSFLHGALTLGDDLRTSHVQKVCNLLLLADSLGSRAPSAVSRGAPSMVAKVWMPCWRSPTMSGRSFVSAMTVANTVTNAVMNLRHPIDTVLERIAGQMTRDSCDVMSSRSGLRSRPNAK